MSKPNAYSIFVHEYARENKVLNVAPLFKELGQRWKEMPEELKQVYKDKAKKAVDGWRMKRRDQKKEQQQQPEEQKQQQLPKDDKSTINTTLKPSTFNLKNVESGSEVKLYQTSFTTPPTSSSTSASYQQLNVKSEFNQNGKRPNENGLSSIPKNTLEQPNDEPQQSEKKKIKIGVPNWKNIKNSGVTINPWRYLDEDIFDLRQKCYEIVRSRGERAVSVPIYTMSCNVMCRARRTKVEKKFVPLEFSIYAYSIEKGALGIPYHCFVNAGKPPSCSSIDAKEFATNHKIPFLPCEKYPNGYLPEARSDYLSIYKEMEEYTRKGERTVLVTNEEMGQVVGSLMWLHEKASENNAGVKLPKASTWTILPIDEYVGALFDITQQNLLRTTLPRFGLLYYLSMLQESSTIEHNPQYMCSFHVHPDNDCKWCAQNCASRKIANIQAILDEINAMHEEYITNGPRILNDTPQPSTSMQQCNMQASIDQLRPSQEDQPMLAILAPQPAQVPPQAKPRIATNDPRMKGQLPVPSEAPMTMVLVGEEAESFIYMQPTMVPPGPPPKKPKEPLVIASTAHRSDDIPDCY